MFDKVTRVDPLMVLTLEEAKGQLNIVDFNDDDDLIIGYIKAAGDMAERKTKLLLSLENVQLEISACDYSFHLRYPPIKSVETVILGEDTEIPFTYSTFSGKIDIDVTGLLVSDILVVNYTAGYEVVPETVKHACRVIVSDLYNNRDSDVDAKMSLTTFNALKLLDI